MINDISISFGVINNINESKMRYSCNIKDNSNGSLIFNLSNNKLIGIHNNKSKYYNNGIFLKYIIKESENKNNIILEIKIMKYY